MNICLHQNVKGVTMKIWIVRIISGYDNSDVEIIGAFSSLEKAKSACNRYAKTKSDKQNTWYVKWEKDFIPNGWLEGLLLSRNDLSVYSDGLSLTIIPLVIDKLEA